MTTTWPIELTVAVVAAGGTVGGALLALFGVLFKTLLSGKGLGLSATQRLVDELQEERASLLARMDSMEARQRGMEADRQRDHMVIAGLRRAYSELRAYVRKAGVPLPPIPPGLGVEDSHPGGLPVVTAPAIVVADLDDPGGGEPAAPAPAA